MNGLTKSSLELRQNGASMSGVDSFNTFVPISGMDKKWITCLMMMQVDSQLINCLRFRAGIGQIIYVSNSNIDMTFQLFS